MMNNSLDSTSIRFGLVYLKTNREVDTWLNTHANAGGLTHLLRMPLPVMESVSQSLVTQDQSLGVLLDPQMLR